MLWYLVLKRKLKYISNFSAKVFKKGESTDENYFEIRDWSEVLKEQMALGSESEESKTCNDKSMVEGAGNEESWITCDDATLDEFCMENYVKFTLRDWNIVLKEQMAFESETEKFKTCNHKSMVEGDKGDEESKITRDGATLDEFDMTNDAKFMLRDWNEVLAEQMMLELESKNAPNNEIFDNALVVGSKNDGTVVELNKIDTLEELLDWLMRW